MNVNIDPSWKTHLQPEFEKDYFKQLIQFVKQEYRQNTCYPKGGDIFAAFDHCPFQEVKVVIIGQDPYHGPNQANGLCFSVK
ncbi:MAG: uracil-DNA glycosylase, partial [Flavobacteriaceae bacterium]